MDETGVNRDPTLVTRAAEELGSAGGGGLRPGMGTTERSLVVGRTKIAVCAGLASIALLAPGAAQGKTKNVDIGTPRSAQETFQQRYQSDVNDFFPHTVTVNVGDSVRFRPTGAFHTVDLPPRGEGAVSFISAGAPAAGVVDAAGAAFWFNGQPVLSFNPELLRPSFGRTLTYNGSRRVNSGLPLQQRPRPMTVRFTRRGSYTYYCDIHPGMRGVVRVRPQGRRVPTAAQDRRAVQAQIDRAEEVAEGLKDIAPPPGVVHVGSAGRGGVEYFGMVPGTITVPVGTTLQFRMSPGSYEDHTATFGPGDPENDPNSYLGQIAAGFQGETFDPRATYPSEPPGTTGTLTSLLHGNGFWNSGVLDASDATPLPAGNAVTFGQPGTFTYACLIHPFMKGTVIVQ